MGKGERKVVVVVGGRGGVKEKGGGRIEQGGNRMEEKD